jgi:hypothetical protein
VSSQENYRSYEVIIPAVATKATRSKNKWTIQSGRYSTDLNS